MGCAERLTKALELSGEEGRENQRKLSANMFCPTADIQPYDNSACLNLVGVLSEIFAEKETA